MTLITSKNEPLKWQSTLRSYKSKNDIKISTSTSSTSVKTSRSSSSTTRSTSKRIDPSARGANIDQKEATKSPGSLKWTGNFILMVELRKKIITFRDIVGLPPLTDNISITNVVMYTIKDIQKLCPGIISNTLILKLTHLDVDKFLDHFYKVLKSIGDSWIDDREWIVKSKYQRSSVGRNKSDRFVENVLAALDGLIKKMNNKLKMMEMCNDQKKKKCDSLSKTLAGDALSGSESSTGSSTPRSVLNSPTKFGDLGVYVSHLTSNGRLQELEKMEPFDVKRFENLRASSNGEEQSFKEIIEKMEKEDDQNCSQVLQKSETVSLSLAPSPPPPSPSRRTVPPSPPPPSPVIRTSKASLETKLRPTLHMSNRTTLQQPLAQTANAKGVVVPPPPPPPPMTITNKKTPLQPLVQMANAKGVATPPPPPPPMTMANQKTPLQPLTQTTNAKGVAAPPPPPMSITNKKSPHQPPTQMPNKKEMVAPPPPPPSHVKIISQATKATTKLKRSTQFGSLYRSLKSKIEGIDKITRTEGRKGGVGSNVTGKTKGMAEALAEMTRKSPFFRKIEEDVQKYMKSINELKIEIKNFQNKDIIELQNFLRHVELVLDKLTDETQILARCEEFPHKKLDTIRTGVSLYLKLNGIIKELKSWKMESPVDQVLEKIEHYFGKMRQEIESLDQIKDDEAKNFKSHKIYFDFNIINQVKETMVDVSSNCMELALKETRSAKLSLKKQKKAGKDGEMLWRAFLLAYKVYTFAGGHDERADKLARDLADEITLTLTC